MTQVTTIRHSLDATATVYSGNHYCGMVFCPCFNGRRDYLASPWTTGVAQQTFASEAEAIDYLVREA